VQHHERRAVYVAGEVLAQQVEQAHLGMDDASARPRVRASDGDLVLGPQRLELRAGCERGRPPVSRRRRRRRGVRPLRADPRYACASAPPSPARAARLAFLDAVIQCQLREEGADNQAVAITASAKARITTPDAPSELRC
jgi:hypothetical protein